MVHVNNHTGPLGAVVHAVPTSARANMTRVHGISQHRFVNSDQLARVSKPNMLDTGDITQNQIINIKIGLGSHTVLQVMGPHTIHTPSGVRHIGARI